MLPTRPRSGMGASRAADGARPGGFAVRGFEPFPAWHEACSTRCMEHYRRTLGPTDRASPEQVGVAGVSSQVASSRRPAHGRLTQCAVSTALVFGVLGWVWARAQHSTVAEAPPPVQPSALSAVELACAGGDARACNDAGVAFEHGYSAPRDSRAAFRMFRRGCDCGSRDACNNLGALYEQGSGTAPDVAAAFNLYTQACTDGDALGCSNLGALYARGRGTARDDVRAWTLFERACLRGSAAGCRNREVLAAR